MRYFRFRWTGLVAAALLLGCGDSTTPLQASRPAVADPRFTVAVGFASTLVARGNAGVFDVNSQANGYNAQVKATSNTDIAVANIVVVPDGTSGWHSHPGPVLVVVKTGAVTFYRAGSHGTCSHVTYHAGAAFIEPGGEVGLAKNTGSIEATVTATYFVPADAALRIDQPAPGGNCPP